MQFDFTQFGLHKKQAEYTEQDGEIRYLDGSNLNRPFSIKGPQIGIAIMLVLAAALIGAYLIFLIYDNVYGSAQREQAAVENNLSREVSYDFPSLPALVPLGGTDAIRQSFVDQGFNLYETTQDEGDIGILMEITKFPSDVSSEEGAAYITEGITTLDATNASKLLNGMWTYSSDYSNGSSMTLRYADFTSGSLEAAIQNAITLQGFDPATTPEDGKGVDDAGNTFQSGSIIINDVGYTWRVSTLPLADMYGISGLPEDAVYVGIRLTAWA